MLVGLNIQIFCLYLHNYFNIHICLSLRLWRPASHFWFSAFSELQKPSQTVAEQGKAKLRILDFKTTWSEFQKASQTAAERGKAELRILNFKTTWSEFQKASQTAAERGEAELRILNSKTAWSEFQKPVRPLLSEAKLSYIYSISKPHGQRFRNPNCCSQQHLIPSPCGVRLE